MISLFDFGLVEHGIMRPCRRCGIFFRMERAYLAGGDTGYAVDGFGKVVP